jgi:Flp pilus assembly pilin Flp
MTQCLKRLWTEERGESLPEYALLVVLICLTVVSTVGTMAAKVNNICLNVSTQMSAPATGPAFTGRSLGYSTESPADSPSDSKNNMNPKPTH